jgi:3',5'-cyclic-AMP phosphodiesterase
MDMDAHGTRFEVTTVADDLVVLHAGTEVRRFDGLRSATDYEFLGQHVRTLERPPGELLSRFATVNDVHFGEDECGRIDDRLDGPILRRASGEEPYPETMSRGAVREIVEAGIATVIVKGDLTKDGTVEEFADFERCYRDAFGEGLHVIRGNHDAYRGQSDYAGDDVVRLAGATVAMIDTTIAGKPSGQVTDEQFQLLRDLSVHSDPPVVVVGHHPQWVSGERSPDYFGINPDDSEHLTALIGERPAIVAYLAGHTHRHRLRLLPSGVPTIEVGCVKDFPGTWAEYRVYESGILQIVHRISNPEALAWSERCRYLYSDFGIDYATYALGTLQDRCLTIGLRPR